MLKVIPSFAFSWYLNQFSSVSQYYSVPQSSASATGPPSSSCHCSSSTKSTTAPSYTSRSPSASTWWRAPAEPLSWPRPPTCCATTPPRRRSRRWSCCPRWRTAARLSPPTMTLPISSNRRPPTHRRRRQTGLVKHPLLSLSLSTAWWANPTLYQKDISHNTPHNEHGLARRTCAKLLLPTVLGCMEAFFWWWLKFRRWFLLSPPKLVVICMYMAFRIWFLLAKRTEARGVLSVAGRRSSIR